MLLWLFFVFLSPVLGRLLAFQSCSSFRVMILGDSISQGKDGDYTWRYRVWESLRATYPDFKPIFVGPWQGTHLDSSNTAIETTGKYAPDVDSAFLLNSNHAAFWGRALAQTKDTVYQWTKDYDPDYLMVMLGFNDLGWYFTDVNGTLANMEHFITQARAAKPTIKFLISNIVDRTLLVGREDLVKNTKEYNARLPALLGKWESSGSTESKIYLVDVNQAYDCRPLACPEGYDGLHPNSNGERSIAGAFVKVLKAGALRCCASSE